MQMRTRRADGAGPVGFLPLEFVEKLAALVPAPRVNLIRYHGILAPAARHRAAVVPTPPKDDTEVCDHDDRAAPARPTPRPRNYSWAELMQRVFAIDVLECPSCAGRMRILAAIHALGPIRAILECVGLPARPPPVSPPDPDPEVPDLFEAC